MDEIKICDIHGHLIHESSAKYAQYEVWAQQPGWWLVAWLAHEDLQIPRRMVIIKIASDNF